MPRLQPGDVLVLNEVDYLYGTGVLRLRVTKVGVVQRFRAEDWVDVEGITLRTDGMTLDNEPRHAVVRVSALRGAIQRPAAGE